MCQAANAATSPEHSRTAEAGVVRVAGQFPLIIAPISAQDSGAGRAEPGGRHRPQTIPPLDGENHSCGPSSPQCAHESRTGA